MENEKILESAQNNKDIGKEYEKESAARSSLLGSLVAFLVALALLLLEYFVKSSVNTGLIAVGMTASGVQHLYEGIKIKKTYMIVIGIIQCLIALLAILVFVGQVVFP
ncbi:MAG: hypothetical protein E7548_01930 [Ruminococcaceae bacterium]|nr:hypothetical protein [Oscillospiraceae bacterium]